MRKTYFYRARINKQTEANCNQWLNLCRRLYNQSLEQRINIYRQHGIYCIFNTVIHDFYIGSATSGIGKRFNKHLHFLRASKHVNKKLQNSWNKYGERSFYFYPLNLQNQNIA